MRKEFRQDVLPLRLIDITATLRHAATQGGIHFVLPSSWHFHVISHTWSLEVRDLSNQIGRKILPQKLNEASTTVISDTQPANHRPNDTRSENVVLGSSNQSAKHIKEVTNPTIQAPNDVIISSNQSTNQTTDEIIKANCATDCNSSATMYNECFAQADLRKESAFEGLVEFLGLLAREGVRYVWFDALCINQTEEREKEREKEREISNMGAYYSNSIGCYVIVHGIGQGYHFWNAEDFVGALPRWFSRVWTLQELFLPAKETFVVELPIRVRRLVKGLIEQNSKPVIGFCSCCIHKNFLQELQDALDPMERVEFLNSCGIEVDLVKSSKGTLQEEIVFPRIPINIEIVASELCGDGRACPTCGLSSLIRQCTQQQHNSVGEAKKLFMMERDAYLFLMYLDTFFPLNACYGSIPRIFSLIKILEKKDWDPCNVFSDIGRRDCTNDEDRVLGVLGLLGVEGDMQVRTGKKADDQLVILGRYCLANNLPELLLKICIVEPVGGPIMGMSWAPSVRYRDFVYEYTGDICGFSLDFIEDCFGKELESVSNNESSNSEFEQEFDDNNISTTTRENQPSIGDEDQVLNMSIVSESFDEVTSQLGRLSNLEQKVDILDCNYHGITMEGCIAIGKIVPYMRLNSHDRGLMRDALPKVNGSTPSIIKANHIPTHCIHFEKSGIFLPLITSLFKAKNRVTYISEPVLVMVDAIRPWNTIYLSIPTCQRAEEALARFEDFLHCVEDEKIRVEVDVQVLLLATSGDFSVLMVCVGHSRKKLRKLGIKIPKLMELNKVGIFVLPKTLSEGIFAPLEGSKVRYLLGGYGDDLTMFVQMRCIRCGKLKSCLCRVYSKWKTQSRRKHYPSAQGFPNVDHIEEKLVEITSEASSSVTSRGISVHVSLYKDKYEPSKSTD
ncbi:hypothetical protein GOP47_0028752 [Adiantum capillus-veneris]|nr:hypothetical protein GOP47_0028752 [Adiantum capillus-veneris]